MSNIYLEKIAALAEAQGMVKSVAHSVGQILKSTGRVAGGGIKATGHNIHNALGGSFKGYAHKELGITDYKKLIDVDGSDKGIGELKKLYQKHGKGSMKDFDEKVIPGLKDHQLDARIRTGGILAGAGYVGSRIKSKIDENSAQQTYYNY
jgi:hypothetical protein